MNNLTEVIGFAPSENLVAFERRLASERLRIMEVINEIRAFSPATKAVTPRKKKNAYDLSEAEMLAAMKELGINSTEELILKLKEIEGRGTDTESD